VESNTALTRLLFFPHQQHQHLLISLLISTTLSLDINNIIINNINIIS